MVRTKKPNTEKMRAGVIGLGLMGHSITACLLAAGHEVVAVTRNAARHKGTRRHILTLLREMRREGLLKRDPEALLARFSISEEYSDLAGCGIVIESIIEEI